MANCNPKIVPSPGNPKGTPKKGDNLNFNFDPPIVFPCHEKVTIAGGKGEVSQQSGSSFQITLTGDWVVVQIEIWCNALVDSETEGGQVCSNTLQMVIGDKKYLDRYLDCVRHCWKESFPKDAKSAAAGMISWGVGGAIVGGTAGVVLGPGGIVAGASLGFGVGLVALPVAIGTVCVIKCFFESLF